MSHTESNSSDCTMSWSRPFAGSNWYRVPFYPDGNATYWMYAFTRSACDTTGLRFQGQFGHARYQSLTVYDNSTRDSVASLRDDDTTADDGSLNPFLLAIDRDTAERSYTVEIVPGSANGADGNTVTFENSIESVSVFLRVYLPDEAVVSGPDDLAGGVPLPTITAFDTVTGELVACPAMGSLPTASGSEDESSEAGARTSDISTADASASDASTNEDGQAPTQKGGRVRFYNLPGGGFYPNPDNVYLTSFLAPFEGTVAIIRLKPPVYADTYDGNNLLRATPEVRYWSLNVCGQKAMVTSACLADCQATIADDGYVYVVLGPKALESELPDGFNFLPWGIHDRTLLIYRNMVANAYFPYSAGDVPAYDSSVPQIEQSAELFIGDFAPIGHQFAIDEFRVDPEGCLSRFSSVTR